MSSKEAQPYRYQLFEQLSTVDRKFLRDYLDTLTGFLRNPETPDKMYEMATQIAQEIGAELSPRMVILSGFPTYVLDIPDKSKRAVPEFDRYYATKYDKTDAMEVGLPCPACIQTNELNSFFPFCNSCKAPFKVRDMIELFPDLDIIVTLDKFDPETLAQQMEEFRIHHGYPSSYDDYEESLHKTLKFMQACNAGTWDVTKARQSVKLDLLAIQTDELLKGYQNIGNGQINTSIPLHIHRNNQMVLYPDNLGTELFISRHLPPIYIEEGAHQIFQQMEDETSKYVQGAGDTVNEVYDAYLNNLKVNYPKNYNIISSSPQLCTALHERIAKYY